MYVYYPLKKAKLKHLGEKNEKSISLIATGFDHT